MVTIEERADSQTRPADGKDQNGQQYNGYAQLLAECFVLALQRRLLGFGAFNTSIGERGTSLTVISFTR